MTVKLKPRIIVELANHQIAELSYFHSQLFGKVFFYTQIVDDE